ncbi:unnamed protein product [Urochloa decumbens]|uniref:Adenylyltransferase and sulfurtransferase MOCS3 n=1 Tax=Urochloa decumbens TaxID=240449 RepID=A0ABC9D7U8_9POAL
MGGGGGRTEAIMREIASLRAQRDELDRRIRFFESQLRVGVGAVTAASPTTTTLPSSLSAKPDAMGSHAAAGDGGGATPDMIGRYRRHLLLPEFGVQGQRKLSRSSVLVVGAGGLGSPVAMHLAACGVGCLGIVDSDDVELGNIHRQVIHIEAYIGHPKVKSAAAACRAINSSVKVMEYRLKLKPKVALDIVRQYDIVIDATNCVTSRYMLSDCCVLLNKPLISGSAFGLEGQLTVYNHNGSPCYRCLFPNPSVSTGYQSCSDNGVLGVVPGVIGCLQALELIKVATGVGEPLCGRMLLFDALSSRFKTVRRRSSSCMVCGENPSFTQHVFMMFDYDNFTKSSESSSKPTPRLNLLPENARVSCREYKRVLDAGKPHLLLDVRLAHHFQIASIPRSLNIPLPDLEKKLPLLQQALNKAPAEASRGGERKQFPLPLYVVSRGGSDSQVAVAVLRENGFLYASDIAGGLEAWAAEADPNFLVYW